MHLFALAYLLVSLNFVIILVLYAYYYVVEYSENMSMYVYSNEDTQLSVCALYTIQYVRI